MYATPVHWVEVSSDFPSVLVVQFITCNIIQMRHESLGVKQFIKSGAHGDTPEGL